MQNKKKAVILLSGGLDSTTVLAIAKHNNFEVYALSFAYGQRHAGEIEAAKNVAAIMGVSGHKIAQIDLRLFGGSALTDNIAVPKDREMENNDIPITYVPARNTIFLAFALAYAETIQAFDIFIGVNAIDYSGYPDCRPEYIQAFANMANFATASAVSGKEKFKIHTPLIHMSKAEIIQTGVKLDVNYAITTSCYDPSPTNKPCRTCDACRLRQNGFIENGLVDPILA